MDTLPLPSPLVSKYFCHQVFFLLHSPLAKKYSATRTPSTHSLLFQKATICHQDTLPPPAVRSKLLKAVTLLLRTPSHSSSPVASKRCLPPGILALHSLLLPKIFCHQGLPFLPPQSCCFQKALCHQDTPFQPPQYCCA
ncbi:hypothetical protein AVEN_137450-1 [Araneus ventricosus]|uniref:Uncharacterized protein n=1 Tax=Araneus ventricosus TaxID=182803 RepID=A0A4Y2JZ43_ARAVE|nr:hypothetical protein AVEN_137450-1 [Araneus ventricosus]